MPDRSTEELVRELTGALPPVKPVAPLRGTLSMVLGALTGGIALSAMFGFPVPGFTPGIQWNSPVFLTLFAGLSAVAAGGLMAGMAGAVPGRDAVVRAGRRLVFGGIGAIAATAIVRALEPAAFTPQVPIAASLMCLARATGLALLPALVACVAVARAFDVRTRMSGIWTCLGAVGLGAVAVHASCAAVGATHVLLGHVVEPAILAVVVGALVAPWLGPWSVDEAS